MISPFLARLDAGDRALFARWSLSTRPIRSMPVRPWRVMTHLGGAPMTILWSLGPALLGSGALSTAGRFSLAILVVSHLIVQFIKRTVGRPRPCHLEHLPLIVVPDRFSFPSGHAAACAALAIGYGLVFPALAPALGGLALSVGFSRVALGVHYPGDVLAGQLISCLTALLLQVR